MNENENGTGNPKETRITKQVILNFAIIAVMIALIVVACADLIPLLRDIVVHSGDESAMVTMISAYGIRGVPILILLQALQVVTTVFPAAAIQVLAGLCYGTLVGTPICLVGIILGNVFVFFIMRRLYNTIGYLFKRRETKKERKFLNANLVSKMKHPEYLAFCFYLIPAIPNGILPYFFSSTKVSMGRYLLAITTACIPSILICTLIGQQVARGHYAQAAIFFGVIALVMAVIILKRDKLMKWLNRKMK